MNLITNDSNRFLVRIFLAVSFWFGFSSAGSSVHAGSSASHWVVVVNGDSLPSRTIANHFVYLRDIPASNVIVLRGIPNTDRVSLAFFRDSILLPVLKEMETRGLAAHVQGIAYSVDFPTSVDVQSEADKIANRSKYLTTVASITGLTYLYRFVLDGSPNFLAFDSNHFAGRSVQDALRPPFDTLDKSKSYAEYLQSKDWGHAAEMVEELLEKLPTPLKSHVYFTAAMLRAKSQDREATLNHLEDAIAAGWCYRKLVQEEESFQFLAKDKAFVRVLKRCRDEPTNYLPVRGFDARQFYSSTTLSSTDPRFGVPYLPSVMLGVARDLGLSEEQVLAHLKRSIAADFQPPTGAFLFMKSSDVRTTTRSPAFPMAIERLTKLGYQARIVEGILPPAGEKCAGLMMGAPLFSISKSKVDIQPGAIAENLTSFGGAMTLAEQTKATEFLKNGAAISSGAVIEPYAIQNKFPHPMIQVQYASGLTAAEAFYASVLSPYQLLILGDPLCTPFATPVRFRLDGQTYYNREEPFRIKVVIDDNNRATNMPDTIECILDGRKRSEESFQTEIHWDWKDEADGEHELRVISKGPSPLVQCYERTYRFWLQRGIVDEHSGRYLDWETPESYEYSQEKPFGFRVLGGSLDGELEFWHESERLAVLSADAKSVALDKANTGLGPIRIQLRQRQSDGTTVATSVRTIWFKD